MTETIAVVKPYYLKEEAYRMGHDRFEGAGDGIEDFDPRDFELSYFKGTATWANNVAPELRAMAGLADRGHGTYQSDRRVAAIKPGCEEDEPAEAELVSAREIFRELVEAFDMGAYDGVEGTWDPDSAQY